jgi:transmembrane sensor
VDELITRALAGEATDLELQRLRHWIDADEQNAREFRAAEAVWKSFDALVESPASAAPALREIIGRAERRRRWPRTRSLLAAAAVVTVAAAGVLAYALPERTLPVEGAEQQPSLSAMATIPGAGGVTTLTLSDGSVVRLAPGAELDFLAEAGRRAVALRGRAFFAVAPGTDPFAVETASGRALALGTRFEVATSGESARVVVVEGTVVLSGRSGGSTSAPAGSVGTLPAVGSPSVEVTPNPWALLDWPGGLLLFQATPLADVAREVERRFGREVRLADPSLATRRVTAWFGEETLEEVMEAICTVTAVSCRVASESVVIGG